ncbi:hypothetical protein DQ392_22020 [Streptomyces reniochalinae]|uniref:Uncharacterized protein n=1 Tax=Streptomyces reniochalinae TaxID=2250578 RepID=A0A367EDC2_9ACTN|nr:hypothetical protein DQ392_22020 [Streptomyces reniochalinae]
MYYYLQGSELMTAASAALARAGQGFVERSPQVVDAAVDALQPAALVAQGVGTGLGDANQGAASFYNWGVLLSGADGARTVFLEGRKALKPHPDDPPNVLAAVIGAARLGGSAAYAFAPTEVGRAAGASVQGAALGIEAWMRRQQATAGRQAPPVTSVPSEAPRIALERVPGALSADELMEVVDANLGRASSGQLPTNPTAQTPVPSTAPRDRAEPLSVGQQATHAGVGRGSTAGVGNTVAGRHTSPGTSGNGKRLG